MDHASWCGTRGASWVVGLILAATALPASAGAGDSEKSASIRQVKHDAKARRAILKEANVKDRAGVEVREFRYLGPSMQFLAEVEVARGEKVESKYRTATIGKGSSKEQRLILIVEPPNAPGEKARIHLEAVAEYGIHHLLSVKATRANYEDIPPLWFEWEERTTSEAPGLTPLALTREQKVLTILEWKIVERTHPAAGAEAPRVAKLRVKAKPLFW